MNNNKVRSLMQNLEGHFCKMCLEVDVVTEDVLEWADNLLVTIEKEITEVKESFSFVLPKTPGEKRARNRRAKNAASKCSILYSTIETEISNFNDTISTRTRAGRRAATSTVSQLNITKDKLEVVTDNAIDKTKIKESVIQNDLSLAAIIPNSALENTSTKPIISNSQETIDSENTIHVTNNKEKLSKSFSGSPSNRPIARKISKTFIISPVVDGNKTYTADENAREVHSANEMTPIVKASLELPVRKKVSRARSQSPTVSENRRKISKTQIGSPVLRSSSIKNRSPSQGPKTRSSRNELKTSKTPVVQQVEHTFNVLPNISVMVEDDLRNSVASRTVTIKKELSQNFTTNFVTPSEDNYKTIDLTDNKNKTPVAKNETFRVSKMLTSSVISGKKTLAINSEYIPTGVVDEGVVTNPENVIETNTNETYSIADNTTIDDSKIDPTPKKKRKIKKEKENLKENIEDIGETVRITRTKSKAIKQMMEENEAKQANLTGLAKKLLNRAKMTSLKKNQLASLLENNPPTPKNNSGINNFPFGNSTTKSKYHFLLSNSKKLKTPLATLPNSAAKIPKPSTEKDRLKPKIARRDSSVENRVINKPMTAEALEREMKLKSKKEKEKEAELKRQNVIKSKQEELRRKNELKHQQAMKQREKLEQEKYKNMIQLEKEKEERHKLILQERQMKLKEETIKKKMITQQKIAETSERRRLEEEARIAKLKELEAEEQRLALEKQREQERQEKRALERLAEKKAREEYELQLKQELEAERLKAEKMSTVKKHLYSSSKMQSATKRQRFGLLGDKREWDYKPRNANDYGLEEEYSEVDSEDENAYEKTRPPVPWGENVLNKKSPLVKILTLEMMCEYMPCYQKTPDIHKMFKMTPSKRIKRTSSAIWNTPSS